MNKVTVYTTDTCPYCSMVKNFLDEKELTYSEINVQKDPVAAKRLIKTTGQMGVPQTEVNGEWVLGFDPEKILQLLK
ncbi:glutaredoxin family protein [Amphibacillus sp. MSJ-3]|uniref:glutaredoxin family protein n=1 Tax=Amphibacillus sp. MSJ-3 TaxID=2841505 RepID=UPI001C0EF84E|nr:glutaredoxin family protein [Amphibacillus sp. MSJ-3]MBU5594130.1 glutaredoxin family protein [Amphibacillus sp. MSJ-3]